MSSRDSTANTFLVAFVLCVVCSVVVSTTAVLLRGIQQANRLEEKKKNILKAAGLYDEKQEVNELFKQVEVKIVELETGEYVNPETMPNFDQRDAARNPEQNYAVPEDKDVGDIKFRAKFANVYLVKNESGQLDQVILPMHGLGLWSTMYGFLALDKDLSTVRGITYYEDGETPGLGAEINNPLWKAKWPGKKIFTDDGTVGLKIVKGGVDPEAPGSEYKIDSISGATITSQGVENMIVYWLGEDAFGPYLETLQEGGS